MSKFDWSIQTFKQMTSKNVFTINKFSYFLEVKHTITMQSHYAKCVFVLSHCVINHLILDT